MVSALPIRASVSLFDLDEGRLWFEDARGSATILSDDGSGNLQLTTASNANVEVGDAITFNDPPDYNFLGGQVIGLSGSTIITTNIPFNGAGTTPAGWTTGEGIKFRDTPRDQLREIYVEMTLNQNKIISVTFDNDKFFPLNNGNPMRNHSQFTMFVKKDTTLNFVIFDSLSGLPFGDIAVTAP